MIDSCRKQNDTTMSSSFALTALEFTGKALTIVACGASLKALRLQIDSLIDSS